MSFLFAFLVVFLSLLFSISSFVFLAKGKLNKDRIRQKKKVNGRSVVGIFHPYCNAGGGGERVLWCAVRAIQSKYPEFHIVIYTGDNLDTETMLQNAKQRFNVNILNNNIQFVILKNRNWVEASKYPHFTLLGQSLGSIVLGFEAIFNLVPDVFIDTMGYAFTFPIFKFLGGCKIACYVHYPTISTDMLGRVSNRTAAYNNNSFISDSIALSYIKTVYYKLFALLYGATGRQSNVVMVNSSWTEDHINQIWNAPFKTHKCYPPCDVKEFLDIPVDSDPDVIRIIAVAQFRPEKDHPLMIRSFYKLMDILTDEEKSRVKLILVGSCRNKEDSQRVEDYKKLCKHFNVDDYIEFYLNVEFEELKRLLGESTIGLHAMWNEHFGISIVECMAAGLITVAHKSGGPMMDIIMHSKGSQRMGFLASDEFEYADTICQIIRMKPEDRDRIRTTARNSVERFSDQTFEVEFLKVLSPLMDSMV